MALAIPVGVEQRFQARQNAGEPEMAVLIVGQVDCACVEVEIHSTHGGAGHLTSLDDEGCQIPRT